jgi:hypothetical protein
MNSFKGLLAEFSTNVLIRSPLFVDMKCGNEKEGEWILMALNQGPILWPFSGFNFLWAHLI